MPTTSTTLTRILTFAGAAPFYLASILMLSGLQPDWATRAFLAYGMVIASFMAGALWGMTQRDEIPSLMLLVVSNIVALAIWAAALMPNVIVSLTVQFTAFIMLLIADTVLLRGEPSLSWYLRLRQKITIVVALAYVVFALSLYVSGAA
ncbi:DUF3429 domain-containing protein [Rhizobium sp. RU36D]|uniref:DUF3429 domain-containing protein n=1 Tax=Rhizobium sp. RU36D TaxID=1907415 RepID=UPI0009D7C3CE|nr:DUF3429 domain-containing protein [Rhizobium sp. RU36D]SMC73249.1 Protein of unknown function [Rhizobium sp. RU36D]